MKAVLLAGGEGTRLRPVSAETPKPMVRLMDKPIMQYGVELLREHGFSEITATLQTLPQKITDYFGDGGAFGVSMRYQVESVPLGTAGGVRACLSHLDPGVPLLVMSGDAVCDFDLTEALCFHNKRGADATLLLYSHPRPLEYGLVMTDAMDRVVRFIEKPSWEQVFTNTINTGIYLLSPEVLRLVPENTFFDFARDLFPLMMSRGMNLFGMTAAGYWCDVGEPEAYLRCCRDILDTKTRLPLPPQTEAPPGVEVRPPVYLGQGCELHEGAVVGPYAVIGRQSRVGRRARVENSVLDGASAGDMSVIEGSFVGAGTLLREGAALRDGAVVGEDCLIGAHAELLGTARLWPHKEVESGARVTGVISTGQGRSGARFGHSSLHGSPHIDLTPEFCLRLGTAAGTAAGEELALAWQGGDAAGLAALALETGICAAGGRPVLTDALFPSAASYAAGIYRFPVTVFVRQKDDLLHLHFFDVDGLPLPRETQRKIEAQTARGETRLAGTRGIGHSRQVSGIMDTHAGAAATVPDWYAGEINPVRHRALTVQVGGGDAATASLQRALASAGCTVRAIGTAASGLPYFAVDEDGLRMTAVDEAGQALLHGRLLAILLWMEAQAGGKRLALPYTAPAMLDELAEKLDLSVLRLERDGTPARELYAKQRFMRDALFGIVRLTYGLRRWDVTLRQMAARVPQFFENTQVVTVAGDRGEIMRRLADTHDGAELVEGFRTRVRGGWVHVSPLQGRRALRVTAEGANAETAAELCDFFTGEMKKIDGQIKPERV